MLFSSFSCSLSVQGRGTFSPGRSQGQVRASGSCSPGFLERFPSARRRSPFSFRCLPGVARRFPATRRRLPNSGAPFPRDSGRLPYWRGRFPNSRWRFPNSESRFPQVSGRFPHSLRRLPYSDGSPPFRARIAKNVSCKAGRVSRHPGAAPARATRLRRGLGDRPGSPRTVSGRARRVQGWPRRV
jgi:hypothetical protein